MEEDPKFVYAEGTHVHHDLECMLCENPLVQPRVASCCGCMFCTSCVNRWTKDSNVCPDCSSNGLEDNLVSAPRFVCNALNDLLVICPACKKQVSRGDFTQHALSCPRLCKWGCGTAVAPRLAPKHNLQCSSYPVPCASADIGCGVTLTRGSLEDHLKECKWHNQRNIFLHFKTLEKQNIQLLTMMQEIHKGPPAKFKLGPNCQAFGQVISKVSDDGKYNSLSFLSNPVCNGKHCWTVILREEPSLVIGVAPTSSDQTATRNCDHSGWYICSVDGSLWSGPPFNYRNAQLSGRVPKKMRDNIIVRVALDMEKRTVSFSLDCQKFFVAYQGIPVDQPLALAVEFSSVGNRVEYLGWTDTWTS